jgi:hypothetical protein
MTWATLILTILANLSKVLPKWYEGWTKRGDLAYLEQRARDRKEKAEQWQKIKEATGDEKRKLRDEYLDRWYRDI